jgi:23S rRNA (uracil1939-C5)-methyltransferase
MVTDEAAQRQAKRELLSREFGLTVERVVSAPESFGYRWSSKRVVGGRRGSLRLGSYRRRSHAFAPMSECQVEHPAIVRAAREVERVASELAIVPYDEQTASGQLRYVWFKTNGAGEVLVTLVAACHSPSIDALAAGLEIPVGVACSVHSEANNALRGSTVRHLRGRERIAIEILEQRVMLGPLGFLQPNPAVATLAYRDLLDPTTPGGATLAYDLYAGAGVTTAALRQRYDRVRGCESVAESAAELEIEAMTAEQFLSRQLATTEAPTLIVANPPRAGLGEAVCTLLRQHAERAPFDLNIMSCGPKALAADLQRLVAGGRFQRQSLRAYDTLPQTPHVELVARLTSRATKALPNGG